MKFTRILPAALCSAMLVGMVINAHAAADEPKAPATKPVKMRPIRLTKPWSLLEDLTQEQKEQINKIHMAALEEKKKIDDKEEADATAVLTDAQKAELLKAEEKEKEAMKAKNKKPTTKEATKE